MTTPDRPHLAPPDAPPVDAALLDTVVGWVREAGELTLRWFRHPELEVHAKGDGSPVTAADRAAERLLRERIGERFPDDAVLGEEEGHQHGESGRQWVVDPIDGTMAFTRGVPLYATLLAFSDEWGPAIGVIHLPALGEVVVAGRGRGVTCDGEPATVSRHDRLAGACLTTSGFDYWDDAALRRLKASPLQMRTWGDGYGYALVATGRVEAMVDPIAARWDLEPMPLILSEAGGRFTTLDGSTDPSGGSGLATNGLLHDEVLALVRPG